MSRDDGMAFRFWVRCSRLRPNSQAEVVVAIALAGLGLVGCSRSGSPAASEPPAPAAKTDVVEFDREGLDLAGIQVTAAESTAVDDGLELNGSLEADSSATAIVTPRAEGKIILFTPGVGDRVASGALVAVLESEHLHDAQLAYALALKKLSAARKDLSRRKKLARLGVYGRPAIEDARKAEVDAAARKDAAEAEIRVADAALVEAKSRLLAESASVEQAEVALKVAGTRRELAERQWQRSERLLAAQVVSRQEHEVAAAQWAAAMAERSRAEADLRVAEARREERAAALESAEARKRNAVKAEQSARAQWEIARETLARGQEVFRGRFSDSKEVAEAEAAVAIAGVEAEGALDDVQLLGGKPGDNHSIPVRAPFAGTVVARTATLGQTVAAGDPILTLVDPSVLFAQLSVFPSDLPSIRVGASVSVRYPGGVTRGVVDRFGDAADTKTRAIAVRVRIPNPGGRLRPGLPVTATVSRPAAVAVWVPASAVQRLENRTVVFVPGDGEGVFVARDVVVGETSGGRTRLREGLSAGERYVSRNAFLVKSQLLKSELAEE